MRVSRTCIGIGIGLLVGATYALRTRRHFPASTSTVPTDVAYRLLQRAAPMLRLPTSPDRVPEVLPDGQGLRCSVSGHIYPFRDGVLDLLDQSNAPTRAQQMLDTPVTAWLYDRGRNTLLRVFGLPSFEEEVSLIQGQLHLHSGDVVLDLACGHGNFTAALARHVGSAGLVIGLDRSPAMLRRAAAHVARHRVDNVLLIRGDAQRLPIADRSLRKVNCSGGFHQLPDLPQAVHEIARVGEAGVALTASFFAQQPDDPYSQVKRWLEQRSDLHFVSMDQLRMHLESVGFGEYHWDLPGGWFGYISARTAAA